MKTAIIFRSNSRLDNKLAGFKENVQLYHSFVLGTTEEQIHEWFEQNKAELDGIDVVYMDFTCFSAASNFRPKKRIVINQSVGTVDVYARQVAREAKLRSKGVIVIKEMIAHHCSIDGIDPREASENRDGWFQEKVLAVWSEAMEKEGIQFEIVSREDFDFSIFDQNIAICDGHNGNHNWEWWCKFYKLGGRSSAAEFITNPGPSVGGEETLEKIPTLFQD